MAVFCLARFELVSLHGVTGLLFELLACVGGGVIIGLMVFGFLGRTAGLVAGLLAVLAMVVFATGFLRDYTVLLASLTAYGTSTLVCVLVSLMSRQAPFDFNLIRQRVGDYDGHEPDAGKANSGRPPALPYLDIRTEDQSMNWLLGFYVLVWPALTLGVLVIICAAVLRDRRKAKAEKRIWYSRLDMESDRDGSGSA